MKLRQHLLVSGLPTIALVIAVGLSTGCGKSPESFCRDLAATSCDWTRECARADFENAYSSMKDCRHDLERAWQCEGSTEADLCFGDLQYDPGNARACLREVRKLSCASQQSPDVCDQICR